MPTGQVRGGAEQSLLQAVTHRPPGWEWSVAMLEPGPLEDRLRAVGADVVVLPAGRLRNIVGFARAVRHLRGMLRSGAFDIAIGWMTKAQMYLAAGGVGSRVPSVWYQLGSADPESRLDRLAARLPTDAVLTVSRAERAVQQRLTPVPVELVYPGADLSRFDPDALPDPPGARSALGLPPHCATVGIVARLQRWKGVHVLIQALPEIRSAVPDIRCIVVGGEHPLEPGYLDEVRELSRHLGVSDRVMFTGPRPDAELCMQAMDVVVHASDHEPFGIVVVEAMALGKPVVATDAGGPREIIADGRDGLLVPFGDQSALTDAVTRLLSDPHLRERLAAHARDSARRFSAERFSRELHAVLGRHAEPG